MMERFILMPDDEKKAMGLAGRRKVEQQFNREIVVEKYLETINSLFA